MVRETQLLAPTSPSLTQTQFRDKTSDLKWWTHNRSEEKMAWKDDKKGKETKWSQPPQRFIPPPSGSLSWPLPSLPPKPWSHGARRRTAASRRPRRAHSNHKAQRTWALKTPLPSSFRRKRPPHLSPSHNSKVKAPWRMLENSGTLFLSIHSITLSYTTLVSCTTPVNKEILFPKYVWVILSYPLSLSMVRFHGSAAGRATWQCIYGIRAVCERFYKS